MERELDIAAARVGENHAAAADTAALATGGDFRLAEISYAPEFDPLDVQEATDFLPAAAAADAGTAPDFADAQTGENEPFDYRKAAVDRHEFLEKASAENKPSGAAGRTNIQIASFGGALSADDDEYSVPAKPDAVLEAAPASSFFAQPDDGRGSTDAPLIETVEISEKPAANVDDLDIPEPEVISAETHAAVVFDDLAEELAGAFGAMEDETSGRAYAAPAGEAPGAFVAHDQSATTVQNTTNGDPAVSDVSADYDADIHQEFGAWSAGDSAEDDVAYDEDAYAAPLAGYEGRKSRSSRRGVIVAALLAGAAVIGGIGVFAFSSGDIIGGGKPALIKADNEPFKVKPKNVAGYGTEKAQNNEVYQRASGVRTVGAPEQTTLVTTAEEPFDLQKQIGPRIGDAAAQAPESDAAVAKTEARLSAAPEQTGEPAPEPEPIAIEPHRVKTFIVKSDGTLVPREEAAPQPAKEASASDAMMSIQPVTAAFPTIRRPVRQAQPRMRKRPPHRHLWMQATPRLFLLLRLVRPKGRN